jgi:heme/copper-type cytochrome/quinol oxidase subunit 4
MTAPNEKKKNVNNFAKYSSISFQMLVTIGLFAFAGYKIDESKNNKTPVFATILSFIGVVVSLYMVIKQLNKNDK